VRRLGTLAAALAVSACATTQPARMHSQAELNTAGEKCGLALGELIQDEEAKQVLILLREAPTPAEQQCVRRFAKRNGLTAVFIDSIQETPR